MTSDARDLLPELEPFANPENRGRGVKSKSPRRPLSPHTIFLETVVSVWRIFFYLIVQFSRLCVIVVGGE